MKNKPNSFLQSSRFIRFRGANFEEVAYYCFVLHPKLLIFVVHHKIFYLMGKGDMKTKRGKIIRGSYGKLRPRKKKSVGKTADTK